MLKASRAGSAWGQCIENRTEAGPAGRRGRCTMQRIIIKGSRGAAAWVRDHLTCVCACAVTGVLTQQRFCTNQRASVI